jgi:hypothetical protein
MSNNFDRWLEDELGKRLDAVDPGYVAPRYLDAHAVRRAGKLGLRAGLPALLATKAATAGMVLVAAASTGAAVTVAASSNSSSLSWGQQVEQQVEKCKAALGADEHGIGQCVSAFAKTHGQSQKNAHSSPSPGDEDSQGDTKGQGDEHANPNGNGDDRNGPPSPHPTSQGKSGSHPTPQGQSGSHPTPPPHPTPASGKP